MIASKIVSTRYWLWFIWNVVFVIPIIVPVLTYQYLVF